MAVDLAQAASGRTLATRRSRIRTLGLAAAELLVAATGYLAYSLSTGAVHQHEQIAFAHAADVVHLEQNLHLFWERQIQAPVLPHAWLVQVFNAIYMWGHLPLIIAVAVWLYVAHRPQYRLVRNAVLISGAIALLAFYGFPLAPPRLVPELRLVDTAALISPVYDTVEPKVFFNPYAAIPSMHIGWDLLVGIGLLACAGSAALRCFGVLLPIGMMVAVIVTGNHYVVDGLAGALVGLAGLVVAFWMEHLRLSHGISGASLGCGDQA